VNAGHFLAKAPKRGRCRHCSKNKIRKEIINMCKHCGVHLCIDYFQSYHRDLKKLTGRLHVYICVYVY
jgi:hypothetical protein